MDDKCKGLRGWILGMFVLENFDKNFSVGQIRFVNHNAKRL